MIHDRWQGQGCLENWQGIGGPFCIDNANERGLRILEFATFNDLVLPSQSIQKMDLAGPKWTTPQPDW